MILDRTSVQDSIDTSETDLNKDAKSLANTTHVENQVIQNDIIENNTENLESDDISRISIPFGEIQRIDIMSESDIEDGWDENDVVSSPEIEYETVESGTNSNDSKTKLSIGCPNLDDSSLIKSSKLPPPFIGEENPDLIKRSQLNDKHISVDTPQNKSNKNQDDRETFDEGKGCNY